MLRLNWTYRCNCWTSKGDISSFRIGIEMKGGQKSPSTSYMRAKSPQSTGQCTCWPIGNPKWNRKRSAWENRLPMFHCAVLAIFPWWRWEAKTWISAANRQSISSFTDHLRVFLTWSLVNVSKITVMPFNLNLLITRLLAEVTTSIWADLQDPRYIRIKTVRGSLFTCRPAISARLRTLSISSRNRTDRSILRYQRVFLQN